MSGCSAADREIDVVIVHYHAAAKVRDAVSALRDDASATNLSVHIVVADNGSTADERALLRSIDVDCVNTGHNAGYAGAMNIAFATLRHDFIVLMNEDVLVLPGCLATLRDALHAGAAVAGPEFYWDRDVTFRLPCTEERSRSAELMRVAGRRSLAGLVKARRAWRDHVNEHWRATAPIPSTSLSGALLAFRRDTWTECGPLDRGFQLYYEENDWLMRIATSGRRCVYVPQAKAIHLHDPALARTASRMQMEAESFVRFSNRYYGETFTRRLSALARRPGVVPQWTAMPASSIPLPPESSALPFWIELTVSPFGFPAAAMRHTNPCADRWHLPSFVKTLGPKIYVQIVDETGLELCGYSLGAV